MSQPATDPATTPSDAIFSKIPQRGAHLAETWAFLSVGVDRILNELEQGLSFTSYTNLYTTAYNYCTSPKLSNKVDSSTRVVNGANLVGADLYNKLIEKFIEHFKTLTEKADTLQDEELLQFYATEWDRFMTGASYLNRLFAYLNRYWVKRERDEGKRSVYNVYTLGLAQWRLHVFNYIQANDSKLTTAIFRLIQRQRNGEDVDPSLVKRVVNSFVSLGIDESDPDKECLEVYKKDFEEPFVTATQEYYRNESKTFMNDHPVSDYLKKVEERLKEEEERVDRCLHQKTRKELILNCEQTLISAHSERLQDSFQEFLDFDRDEDLQRMYSLLSRIPDGLDPLRNRFGAHVKKAGLAAVAKLVGEGGENADSIQPKMYVDALLAVHQKAAEIVQRSFKNEAGFSASLDKAAREFVNRNAAIGKTSSRSSELLAKHADLLLRKSNKMVEEEDLDSALNRVMVLFKYLEDKDVFQNYYSTKLSKRLIHQVSASDEAESSMISKLKEACGFEYTNKLQRMFTDISLSKDLTDSFKERMAQNHGDGDISFSIQVLGTNFWPVNPPSHGFTIPPELTPTYDRFLKYYQSKHQGRKLTWLWNYSKNELRTNYLNQKYMLMTSAYQTAVLLQYNRHDTLSLDDLIGATAISKEILIQVLALLVKAKVLINQESEQYDLNPSFKSKKIRVNLNQPIKAETKQEADDVQKATEEDRKYVTQASIVRIMKARKTMKNQALIQEVISQISQRFAPQISDIKKAIETLLEKEYLERVPDQKDTFNYVA
ncbi:Cullin-domain-containing protein [Fistulina hepatica ATCC 64428]|uniref:Cullin-1 n=1 Tax=Fistulina hepatica ATCC 64428 TaxID=1128425 RepID=A0A0D7A2I6_9AGAR|nr:Cullin-domain-containing protein [Fistulina hepatica ATCC 64428]